MGLTSAEPALYSVDDAGTPTLFGARDTAGNISFPFQTYGSESNGDHGSDLSRVELCGIGTVTATATVFRHASDTIATPFTVASVVLDEGPMIRAVLADGSSGAQRGDKVRATTSEIAGREQPSYELRFTLVSSEKSS
jgi:uncharacterized protein